MTNLFRSPQYLFNVVYPLKVSLWAVGCGKFGQLLVGTASVELARKNYSV